eukprot:3913911-Karenia_brevis.AAC.1
MVRLLIGLVPEQLPCTGKEQSKGGPGQSCPRSCPPHTQATRIPQGMQVHVPPHWQPPPSRPDAVAGYYSPPPQAAPCGDV